MQLYKNSYGSWTAETEIKLTDTLVLEILTMKRFSGDVATTAKVSTVTPRWKSHAPFSDFNKHVITQAIRCTEKNVKLQHEEALQQKDVLIQQAKLHHKVES